MNATLAKPIESNLHLPTVYKRVKGRKPPGVEGQAVREPTWSWQLNLGALPLEIGAAGFEPAKPLVPKTSALPG
jgi:hypothetical protein